MKKYPLSLFLFVIALLAMIGTACNKSENNDPLSPSTWRLIEESVLIHYDTSELKNKYVYEEGKLDQYEHYVDGELYSRAHFSYQEGTIIRTDSNFNISYYDSIPFVAMEYQVQNNHIVQARALLPDFWGLTAYNYSGDQMLKWENFSSSGHPVSKGEYSYDGEKITRYEWFEMKEDWELMMKNDYTYQNGEVYEVFFYYGLLNNVPEEPGTKKRYLYDDDRLEKILWYYPDTANNWNFYFETLFTYDENGNIPEIREYSLESGEEEPYYTYYFTYEQGEGNKEMFDEAMQDIPLLERGFEVWGLFSASSRKERPGLQPGMGEQ
jgi:hypothetical protein